MFIPVLKLIFLIDSTLISPLFFRDKEGTIISDFLDIDWYSEENRTFLVTDDYFKKIRKQKYYFISKTGIKFLSND